MCDKVYVARHSKHRPPTTQPKKKVKNVKVAGPDKSERLHFHLAFYHMVLNLKRCYGCKKEFSDRNKKPPNDVIIKHFCHRVYKNANGVETITKNLQAAYFHLNLNCIRKVVPNMELRHILINDDVKEHLSVEHKMVLRKFGLNI